MRLRSVSVRSAVGVLGAILCLVLLGVPSANAADGELHLTGDSEAWTADPGAWDVTYYWSTCGEGTYECQNSYTLQLKAWPVYSQTNADRGAQFVDFFLIQLTTNLNLGGLEGCWDFYKGDHAERIAAYWLRRFEVSAEAVAPDGGWPEGAVLQIDSSAYNPRNANPSTQVQQGISWSLGGTGKVGPQGSGIDFNAGVSFSNSRTTTYDALAIAADVQPAGHPHYLGWAYDAWEYVHETIQPGDHTCAFGSGLRPLPSILTNTATSVQSWVYRATPGVREAFAGGALPVRFDFSVLLGYAFYGQGPNISYCGSMAGGTTQRPIGSFPVQLMGFAHTVGDLEYPETQGLAFHVSCHTRTQYGTIPLGPPLTPRAGTTSRPDFTPDWRQGNPGMPLPMDSWVVNIPFASIDEPAPAQAGAAAPATTDEEAIR